MLSKDQKLKIAAEASKTLRLAWKQVPTRTLGELVANITHRHAEGTLNVPTFTEYADAQYRSSHAERVTARDDALDIILNDDKALTATLVLLHEMVGPEGVIDFAYEHGLDPHHCAVLLERAECSHALERDKGPELGD